MICESIDSESHARYPLLPYVPLPNDEQAHTAHIPTTELSYETRRELSILEQLTKAGCPHTPALLGYIQEKQGKDGCLPDGYAFYMLMTKLPGEPPLWFRNKDIFTRQRRDQLREDFTAAYL